MDAIIFDFDGVIVDAEPIHLMGFQRVLGSIGVDLSPDEYYSKYVGYDDRDCFTVACSDKGVQLTDRQVAELTAAKTAIVKKALSESACPLPGAVKLIRAAADSPAMVGVCSAALREEIRIASQVVGVLEYFETVISAEDVKRSKPDPEGYLLTIERLSEIAGKKLKPALSVVVEDSPQGIQAAKAAGMKVLAVTNSCPSVQLQSADRIVDSLTSVTIEFLGKLL